MFERFTDRARRVVVLAQEEARLLGHNYIGTEHILLGLAREEDGVAALTLRSLGVSLDAVRDQVREIIDTGGSSPAGHIPFTPRAKKVLELSLREAQRLGHNHIGTEHILLGLLREGEGVAAQVLVNLGAGLDRVRDRVVEVLTSTPAEGVFSEATAAAAVTLTVEGAGTAPLDPPRCPRCAASLTTATAYRAVEATTDEAGAEPVTFVVVYCKVCGTALGTAPS